MQQWFWELRIISYHFTNHSKWPQSLKTRTLFFDHQFNHFLPLQTSTKKNKLFLLPVPVKRQPISFLIRNLQQYFCIFPQRFIAIVSWGFLKLRPHGNFWKKENYFVISKIPFSKLVTYRIILEEILIIGCSFVMDWWFKNCLCWLKIYFPVVNV